MKDSLNILEKVTEVETPPFLFTRIQAKIQAQLAEKLSRRQMILYSAGLIVFVVINIAALKMGKQSAPSGNLVSEMGLSTSHQLYR